MAEIKIIAGNRAKVIDLDELMEVDPNDLTNEFASQAALYAHYATLLADADEVLSNADISKDEEYSTADLEWRLEMAEAGEKVTEGKITALVRSDETVVKAMAALVEAQHNRDTLRAVVRALEMRADMLVSLGAHLRHEMEMTGMTISQRRQDDDMNSTKEALRRRKAAQG